MPEVNQFARRKGQPAANPIVRSTLSGASARRRRLCDCGGFKWQCVRNRIQLFIHHYRLSRCWRAIRQYGSGACLLLFISWSPGGRGLTGKTQSRSIHPETRISPSSTGQATQAPPEQFRRGNRRGRRLCDWQHMRHQTNGYFGPLVSKIASNRVVWTR
jgi:hypothetical protein